jgi:HlyD family secretion protein
MRAKKRRIIVVALAVPILIGVLAVTLTSDRRSRTLVQTQKIGRKDLTATVTASGEIRPKRYVNVSSDVPGRITQVMVKEGDTVRAGQSLCRIDATRFAATTRQSEAGLQAARADLKRTEADLAAARFAFERARRMQAEQLVSEQDFDRADADFKMKQALVEAQKRRIAQLEAALESDQDSLQKTTVASPMDGVITALLKEEGETVIGAQSFQPTIIMTVADLSVMEVEVLADETDIASLKLGLTANVRVDALPDIKIKGEVTEIGASAIVRGSTGTTGSTSGNQAKDFRVTVTLKDPPRSLRPGLNATADITTAQKSQILAVPIQAVVVRAVDKEGKVVDPGGSPGSGAAQPSGEDVKPKGEEKEGLFVVSGGQVSFRPVKTGILGESEIELTEGVKEGEEIVTGSYKTLRTLKDKAKVRVEQSAKGKKGK